MKISRKIQAYKFLLGLVGLLLLQPLAAASANELLRHESSHSSVRVLLERTSLVIGETTWLAIEVTPQEGWHTYWQNPGDSGAAPIFEWVSPEGVTVGKPVYGSPAQIPVAHLMNYGFRGRSTMLVPVNVTAKVAVAPLTLEFAAEWLVCKEECVPQVGNWTIDVPAVASAPRSVEARTLFVKARSAIPELAYWDAKLVIGEVSSELYVFADQSDLAGLETAYYFPVSNGAAIYAKPQLWSLSEGGLLVRMPRSRGDIIPTSADGVLTLNFDNGTSLAFALEPQLKIPEVASAPVSGFEIGVMPLWQAALYAFFGGLILNLMPCVFPILSLKAFAFVAANYKTAANRRKEGWAYTLGIWISFMAIVVVLLLLRSGGAAIGWGFQLQEPLFVGLLAILMVLVALSLAGLFNIQLGFEGAGQSLASREGAQGAFFKGVLATLVATPCTAPLMAPAIGFALTQPIPIVITVFSLLALGLALPFLLLSYSERVAAAMPRPGPWMEKVKQGLAFPMLLTAAWLIYVFDLQAGATATLVLLISAILVAFSIWLWGQSSHVVSRTVSVFVLVLSIIGLVNFAITASAPKQTTSDDVQGFSEQYLNALLDEGRPVFVYFTAEWCITCKVNEKVALDRSETQAAFRAKNVTILKGDWTNRNDEIARILARYGRAGVPLYLYFPAGVREAKVLPEIITSSSILDIL